MFAQIREHKRTLIVLCLIVLGVAFLTYQFVSVDGVFSDLKNDLKTIEPKAEGAYQNLNGEAVSLNEFKGKVLVVNSWATWTPFSKDELNVLSELQAKYSDKVTIIAINRKEQLPIIRGYLKAQNLNQEGLVYLYDPTDYFYTASGGHAMPETIVYAKDGTIQSHIRGTLNRVELEVLLNSLTE